MDMCLMIFGMCLFAAESAVPWILQPSSWGVILQVAGGLGFVIFVHELGHYLGLGEPGYDWHFDQSDTAMSYNPDFANVPSGWQNFFTGNDLAVLIKLHGAENDFFENTVVNGRQFLSNGVDSLTGQSNFNIGLLGGNDFLEVVGGSDNFANGNMGDDT